MRQAVWQPPWACPSQRTPARCTASRILRMPVAVIVSHSLWATLYTVKRWPQYSSISGMNGSESSSPRSSSVARISSALRTSTSSPTRRPRRPLVLAAALICTAVSATVRTDPTQLIVEPGLALEALDLGQAHVTAAEELVGGQVEPPVGLVQLLDALADGPPRPELGQDLLDLAEVHAVVPGVGAGAIGELHPAASDHRLHHVRYLAHPEVLLAEPHVEGLVVDAPAIGLEAGHEGSADVLDVDQGAPR